MERAERPEDQRAASGSLERLRSAAVALDRSGLVVGVNAKAEQLLGSARASLLGSRLMGRASPSEVAEPIKPPRMRASMVRTVWMDGPGGEQLLVHMEVRRDRAGNGGTYLAVLEEATTVAKAETALAFEREILGLIAAGLDAPEVLSRLGASVKRLLDTTVVFFAADRGATHLSLIETEPMPPVIGRIFGQGIPIAVDAPACGQAAARKRPVIVRDIAAGSTIDPVAKDDLVATGIRACWAHPVMNAGADVLGSVIALHPEARDPDDDERALMERTAALAALVLARVRTDEDRFALEHRYRTLATMSSDFAYCFEIEADGQPRLAWVTDAFQRITSYEPEEWVRIGAWRGIIHPDDLLAFEQRLPRLMAGEEVGGDLRIVTKSGDIRWLSLLTRPIRDPASGRVTSIIGSAHDFTARKEAEDAKTMFLATASHELKTPLTVIQGFAQMLETSPTDEELGTEAIGAIRRRAVQLNKIIDRILLSSRIETGRASVALSPVAAGPIVRELVEALAGATGRDIAVEGDEIPMIEADPDAFTSVIDHVLDNAVKYSPEGGPIRVRALTEGEKVIFEISDRGIGMSSEQLARCFEKFWQAESTDVRRFGGTGIGLFIVRSLTEAMGGSVDVSSAPGQGSTFRVALRRSSAEEPASVGAPTVIEEFMRQLGIPGRRDR